METHAGSAPSARTYLCHWQPNGPVIDGNVDKSFWATIPWTEFFQDIEGDAKPVPRFKTRAKMAWTPTHFLIAAELEEPHVWGTLTEHNSIIFQDNDFEVFIDPDGDNHNYAELEVNALNTTWNLLLPKPYRDGGPALVGWEMPGLQTAVRVHGTLNDPSDEDQGWTLEIAIPWQCLKEICIGCESPPRRGDQWRVNFSRVQWHHEIADGRYLKVAGLPEDNWVWSSQEAVDMHRPEKWGIVQFGMDGDSCRPYPGEADRLRLMDFYWAQRAFNKAHSRYAENGIELQAQGEPEFQDVSWRAFVTGFEATLGGWMIREDSRLLPVPKAKPLV